MVDTANLSELTESVKVPHDLRRKSRSLSTELALWKAQEHKNFILYIGTSAFTEMLHTAPDVPLDFVSLYHLLSVAI